MAAHARRDFLEEVRRAVEADGRYIMREDPNSDRVSMRKKGAHGHGAETSVDVGDRRAFTVAPSVAKLYRTWFGRNRGEWPANLPLVKSAETAAAMQATAAEVTPAAPRPDRMKIVEMMNAHQPVGNFMALEQSVREMKAAPKRPMLTVAAPKHEGSANDNGGKVITQQVVGLVRVIGGIIHYGFAPQRQVLVVG